MPPVFSGESEPSVVRTRDALLRLDRRVTLAVQALHGPDRDRLLRRVSFLGSQRFLLPATFAAAAALLLAGRGMLAALLGGAVLGGRGLSPIVKWCFRRGRPDLWPALETEKSHSFPSTHTATATSFFGAACVVVFHLTASPAARVAAAVLCAILPLAIAFSRIYLGAHWLSDVVGGLLLGLVWVAIWTVGSGLLFHRPPGTSLARPASAASRARTQQYEEYDVSEFKRRNGAG